MSDWKSMDDLPDVVKSFDYTDRLFDLMYPEAT